MNTIYTLGYSGLQAEQLHAAAQEYHLKVIDVRLSPRSRVVTWTGARLRALLGDDYLHLPAFGNVNYKNDGPIQLAAPTTGVRLASLELEQHPILLLCACRDLQTCHRLVVANLLAEATGVPVVHWTPADLAAFVPVPKDTPIQLQLW